MMKFIDLSIPIINPDELVFDPPLTQPHIDYHDHDRGAEEMAFAFYKLKPDEHLPEGKGWATDTLELSTHSGTHMDAPWHFAPIQDKEIGEKKAQTIDDFPLEWGIGQLVVLDCTDFEDGYILTPEDVKGKLEEINHVLQEGDILCIHTKAAEFYGTKEYVSHGVGIGKDATLDIVRKGVHVVGTDAWSWDAPFVLTNKKWKKMVRAKEPDPSIIWEGHFAGIERGYYQMEKLTNLDKVPAVGATIYCFPVKIARASAGWVRAVATIPE
ncbi:MAG: cyclase family protein [Candidatus Lokiarchaeota archaeon]|nr:cyclase family protein [Candidatus Lokiarchaeota archaeon]MBD3339694.1 cyclase family protein [Candidatus Lokiarchaeota archaeon]